MLSLRGRCFTPSGIAGGRIRGEGSGAVCPAIADALPHLAVLSGSCVNQDGHSATLVAFDGLLRQIMHRMALRGDSAPAGEAAFRERYGTSTGFGGPMEVGAVQHMGAEFAADQDQLWLCSLESRTGCLHGVAGVSGLVEIVLLL
jgi:hybrid polyketide synthase/nonribosomal peptide synthetase FtdB